MDFAADAVFDVVAPPSRPANARPAPSQDTSEPSFDDHLEAATADEAPREDRAKPSDDAKANETTDTESEAPAVQLDTAPQSEPPAPPHIVQIVAAPAPVAATAELTTPPSQASAPIDATIAPEAPTPQAPAAAPPVESSAENADDAGQSETKADAPAKNAVPVVAPQSDAATDTNAAPQAAPVQTNVAPQQTAPLAPVAEAPPPEAAAIAASPIPVERATAAPQRASKPDTQRGAKSFEAAIDGAKVDASSPNTAQTQKSASATTAGKDAGSSLIALQADAPEIPAPSAQQSGTPFAHATSHSQPTASIDHTAAARAMPANAQVAREIVRRFDGKSTTFDLRLDPPELGRVEVRLEVSRDNRVSAVIAADSPQALTELSRHARDLEQMLNDAGLQLSDSGLSFDLRQGSEDAADASESNARGRAAESGEDAPQQISTAARPLAFERWRGVRVDVTV